MDSQTDGEPLDVASPTTTRPGRVSAPPTRLAGYGRPRLPRVRLWYEEDEAIVAHTRDP